MSPASEREPALPAVHALHLAALVARWHVPAEELLAPLDLREQDLADPDARLPLDVVERLVGRARAMTGEPALGIYLGLQMRASSHGYVGFAAMTAPTVRDALELAVRFAPTRTSALALRLHVEGARASLVLEERARLGTMRDVVVLALLVGLWQMGNALTGRELTGSVDLAFAEPDYFARFRAFAPGPVRFGQPAHQLVFDAALLDLPLALADPAALRLARAHCERQLDALGYDEGLVERVRRLIPLEAGGFRTLDDVARHLHVSPRTLKRRLAAKGSAFSELLDAERRDRALLLLRSPELSVEQVAERVGYSDAANFARAFRRWTGMTPSAFRRSSSRPG